MASLTVDILEDRQAEFVRAFNANDLERLMSLYNDGAIVVPAGEERRVIQGKDDIRALLGDRIAQGIRYRSITTESVQADRRRGDVAYEIARFLLEAPAADGRSQTKTGLIFAVWRHAGDEWRLDADVFL